MNSNRKIVFIGIWMVGASGLYSCITRNVAQEYVIIDIFSEFAEWQKLDLEDSIQAMSEGSMIKVWDYWDCSDADVVVISAWRPQKPWETRLEMLQDNAAIMKKIARNVGKSWFSGVTLVVSNPVDIMTRIYQQESGLSPQKVISSGCQLDTMRLRLELKKRGYQETAKCYMIWEHGDSSVGVFADLDISDIERTEIEAIVRGKAEKIIQKKKSTYFGIGSIISDIISSTLNNSEEVFSIWRQLAWEYDQDWVYSSFPSKIWKEGVLWDILNLKLSNHEANGFKKSCTVLSKEFKKLSLN